METISRIVECHDTNLESISEWRRGEGRSAHLEGQLKSPQPSEGATEVLIVSTNVEDCKYSTGWPGPGEQRAEGVRLGTYAFPCGLFHS